MLLADDDLKVRSPDCPRTSAISPSAGRFPTADGLVDQVGSTRASVVLLDWDLPGLHATDVLARLRTIYPACSLVVLSGRPEHCGEVGLAGITRFVCKGDPPESLLVALNETRRNGH